MNIINLTEEDIKWCDSLVKKIASKKPKSRKQSKYSEYQTSMEGARAELAGAYFLCKDIAEYKTNAMIAKSNRGRDLPVVLTGLPKPVEIKFTPVKTEKTGCLFLRPPVGVGLAFDRHTHIDPSLFVLVYSPREDLKKFEVLGWIDNIALRDTGKYNPVPRMAGQYETFGIHWADLFPIASIKMLDS